MRVLLAPMEGVLDDVLRTVLTGVVGGAAYDCAVTEFVRVSGNILPLRFFRRVAPELNTGGRTLAGTPVRVQLLGSDPVCMADNAARLATLSPVAVDLNFGCPAPTVNRHRGGAVLLDEPELLYAIVSAVRSQLPPEIPLTAKMRLGVSDTAQALACAQALAAGGACELVVHGRTRAQGYRPPAEWAWIGRIAQAVSIPVVANGEVWSVADWLECHALSGVSDVMLGRGAVADPFLVQRIRAGQVVPPDAAQRQAEWAILLPHLGFFRQRVLAKLERRHVPGRIKQWLKYLHRTYPQAERLYTALRTQVGMENVDRILFEHGVPVTDEVYQTDTGTQVACAA